MTHTGGLGRQLLRSLFCVLCASGWRRRWAAGSVDISLFICLFIWSMVITLLIKTFMRVM